MHSDSAPRNFIGKEYFLLPGLRRFPSLSWMKIKACLAVLAVTVLSGCATFKNAEPAPRQTQPMALRFQEGELSSWNDLPLGIYRVPNSQVIVSGHQKGGAIGMLLGPVALAVQNSLNTNAGRETTTGAGNALQVNLTNQARSIASRLLSDGSRNKGITTQAQPGAPVLTVATAVVLNFQSDTEARPYVVLKVELRGAVGSKPIWSTKYFSSTAEQRPLVGPGSWTADQGSAFRRVITEDLERGMAFMIADILDPQPRDSARLTVVQGNFPFMQRRFQTTGYLVGNQGTHIAFIPRLSDVVVFTGINVMDKSVTTYRPATSSDSNFKVLD